jgi:hypothetical protein
MLRSESLTCSCLLLHKLHGTVVVRPLRVTRDQAPAMGTNSSEHSRSAEITPLSGAPPPHAIGSTSS